MSWYEWLSRPEVLVFLLPICAIAVGGAIAIAAMLIRHKERMAMIEKGMHPDAPPKDDDPDPR